MTAPGKSGRLTVAAALWQASQQLAAAGIEQPRLDARLLLAKALGTPNDRFYGMESAAIAPDRRRAFMRLVVRRRQREPVSRIIGQREFWSLPLAINATTFDPRPDSETLISAVLDSFADRSAPLRVLDLGTGSGCLLLAALQEYRQARGVGVDSESACVAVSRRNAAALGLANRAQFRCGDWTDGLAGQFDVILCNPPYIPTAEIAALECEVARHEPVRALDGGADGLDCYRRLADGSASVLASGGRGFIEVGAGQAVAVQRILAAAGLRCRETRRDLGGRLRCLVISHDREEEKPDAGLD